MRLIIVGVVMGIIAIMIGINMFPMVLDASDDIQVDQTTVTNNSTTGVGETTEDVAFADPLFEDDTVNVTSVASDNGSDTPVASSYSSVTDTLTVSGLQASGTRVLTIVYDADALSEYTGLSPMVKFGPFLIFFGLIAAALGCMWQGARSMMG